MKNTFKVERARNNIIQTELADKVNVSRQTINAIESGKFIASTLLAFKIAHILQITVDAVFQLEDFDW